MTFPHAHYATFRFRRREATPTLHPSAAVATVVAGLATVIGVKALAHAGGPWGWQRAGFMQLAPLVKSAARDLLPVRARMREARRQAVELLSRETVDRIGRWHGHRG
jgi:hypothetical protein